MDVKVIDSNGEPIAGAAVNITSAIDGASFELLTDAGGTALFEYIPHSDYVVNGTKDESSGTLRYEQKEDSLIEIVIKQSPSKSILSGGGGIAVFIIAIIACAGIGAYLYIRRKGSK